MQIIQIKYQDIALLKKVIPELISKILVQKCNIAIKDSSSEISYIFDIMELLLFKYNFLSSKNIDYTGGRKMKNKMIDIQSIIYDKIDGNDICVCNNIDEYCFAVGQLARYMINQNAGKNVTFKEISPLLNCKDCLSLSKALDNLMKKYDFKELIKIKEYWGYRYPEAWCKECGCKPCKCTNVIFVKEIR